MKIRHLLLFGIVSMIFASCGTDLNFTEPQPPDTKDQHKFKKRYRGEYLSLTDSSILTITDNAIMQTFQVEIKTIYKEMDTTLLTKVGDSIYLIEGYPGLEAKRVGDSAYVTGENTVEVFSLSDNQVLRYYKGYYFLNTLEKDDFWTVRMMGYDKGVLSFKRFAGTDGEIAMLSELTAIDTIRNDEGDIVNYSIHPTIREFKEILKVAHIGDDGTFRKIK